MENKSISSDLIRGHIETIILNSLLDGDKFAQQISDYIDLKSDKQYEINQATLYSSLKRLENLKYVNAYWHDSGAGGRRRYFKLTDSGRQLIDDNISNWSFSRNIIDKLINYQPEPVIQTQIIEKIVTVPASATTENLALSVEQPIQPESFNTEAEPVAEEVILPAETATIDTIIEEQHEEKKEINFRNVLNTLIKSTSPKKDDEVDTINEAEADVATLTNEQAPLKENTDIINFNDIITESSTVSTLNNGKIDFSDIKLKAQKEGYKVRISTKNEGISTGNIYSNKLKLICSLIVFFMAISELLIISFAISNVQLPILAIALTIVALAIFPIVVGLIYYKNPQKTCRNVKKDGILTSAIIVFNLLLITFAGNLLFGADFSDLKTIVFSMIFPCTLYLDIICFYVFKYWLSRKKAFRIKN